MTRKITNWDIRRGHGVYKSVNTAVLKKWIKDGRINIGEVLVWTNGMSGWRRPEQMDAFKPLFKKKKKKKIFSSPSRPSFSQKKEKILIIDDEKDICGLLERYLRRRGFYPFSSQTGRQGLEMVKQEKFDVVLLDLRLPDMNGLNVLRHIKKIRPRLKVIMISAFADAPVREKAVSLGAACIVDKPFKQEEIFKIIKKV